MAKLKLSKREVWMLHYLLDFHILRYMMCNAINRPDAAEKADVHIEISKRLAMFFLCEGTPRQDESANINKAEMPVHDYLAEILTDRMDEVIGYPLNRSLIGNDFAFFGNRFFNVILEHTVEIKQLVEKKKKDRW